MRVRLDLDALELAFAPGTLKVGVPAEAALDADPRRAGAREHDAVGLHVGGARGRVEAPEVGVDEGEGIHEVLGEVDHVVARVEQSYPTGHRTVGAPTGAAAAGVEPEVEGGGKGAFGLPRETFSEVD